MKITVQQASAMTGIDVRAIRAGMRKGVLPFGFVIPAETKNGHDAFYIEERRVIRWMNGNDFKTEEQKNDF